VKAGYNCLALDARSGAQWAGTLNETAARAKAKGLDQRYAMALDDLMRAVQWARELGYTGKLAVWGSSYSAALVLFRGMAKGADCVVAFSPGDYVQPKGSTLEAAARLAKPVLVVCPPKEERGARAVFDLIPSETKEILVHEEGLHGSRTLYVSPKPEPAWEKVLAFLEAHLRR
jgi:dienelactone hydrolase